MVLDPVLVGAAISCKDMPILTFDPRLFGAAFFCGEGSHQLWPRPELGFEFVQGLAQIRRFTTSTIEFRLRPESSSGPAGARRSMAGRCRCARARMAVQFGKKDGGLISKLNPWGNCAAPDGTSQPRFPQHRLAASAGASPRLGGVP